MKKEINMTVGSPVKPLLMFMIPMIINQFLQQLYNMVDSYVVGRYIGEDALAAVGASSQLTIVILIKRVRSICGDTRLNEIFSVGLAKEMIVIGVPSVLQQSIIYVGMLLIQSSLNPFGSSVLAGYVAAIKIDNFSVLPQQAIGNAMSAYTGQNLGAGKKDRIGEGLKWAIIVSLLCNLIILIVLQLFAEPILLIFLKESSQIALDTGAAYLRFYSVVCFLMVKFATDGVLRAVGEMRGLILGNLLNFGSRVFLAKLLCPIYGPCVVHYVIPMGMIINLVISLWFYYKGSWRK